MSNRRSRSRQSTNVSRITDDQLTDLLSKIQHLVPEIYTSRHDKVSASKLLQETCNYINNLHKQVDDLSERLADLLTSTDCDTAEVVEIIRRLIDP